MILNSKYSPWNPESLTELFDIVTGSTPSTKDERFWSDGNVVWVTPADLSQINSSIFINNSERKIAEVALNKSNLTILPIDSIILSTRAPVGYVAINKKELCFNQGCKGLVTKERDYVDPLFYYYYFSYIRNYLESISSGSTFKELSKDSLKNLSLPFPDKKEQTAIANILSTIDDAIQKADEAVKKTERIKKSMLQKLLTEGIGHTEFKETKIGRIPKDWEVKCIGDLGKAYTGKTPSSSDKSLWNGNVPFVTPGDISETKYVTNTERYVSESGKKVATILPHNSLMVVCIGSTIGKVALTGREVITNQQINSLIVDEKVFYPDFIYYSFIKKSKVFKALAGTAAVPIINKTLFEKFQIPISTNKEEQKKISDMLSEIDNRLFLLKNRKYKYLRIKQGLMDDLLTGRKRVKL